MKKNIRGTIVVLLGLIIILPLACTFEQVEPTIDCSISPLVLSIAEKSDSDCDESNGSFSISVEGGTVPYEFSSELGSNVNGIFSGVGAGNYTISVTDAQGCENSLGVEIKNSEGVNIDDLTIEHAGCGTSLGSIAISASGGEEPYAFSLNGGDSQQSNIFSNLAPGSFDVVVTDALGCETTQNVNLTTDVSYAGSIKDIIETNCAISGCHNGNISPDLRSFGSIQASAGRIKARTGNRSMPRGRTLTQAQIDQIACWVDDGALDN